MSKFHLNSFLDKSNLSQEVWEKSNTQVSELEDITKEFFYLADLRKISESIFTIDGGYITASLG